MRAAQAVQAATSGYHHAQAPRAGAGHVQTKCSLLAAGPCKWLPAFVTGSRKSWHDAGHLKLALICRALDLPLQVPTAPRSPDHPSAQGPPRSLERPQRFFGTALQLAKCYACLQGRWIRVSHALREEHLALPVSALLGHETSADAQPSSAQITCSL